MGHARYIAYLNTTYSENEKTSSIFFVGGIAALVDLSLFAVLLYSETVAWFMAAIINFLVATVNTHCQSDMYSRVEYALEGAMKCYSFSSPAELA